MVTGGFSDLLPIQLVPLFQQQEFRSRERIQG